MKSELKEGRKVFKGIAAYANVNGHGIVLMAENKQALDIAWEKLKLGTVETDPSKNKKAIILAASELE